MSGVSFPAGAPRSLPAWLWRGAGPGRSAPGRAFCVQGAGGRGRGGRSPHGQRCRCVLTAIQTGAPRCYELVPGRYPPPRLRQCLGDRHQQPPPPLRSCHTVSCRRSGAPRAAPSPFLTAAPDRATARLSLLAVLLQGLCCPGQFVTAGSLSG